MAANEVKKQDLEKLLSELNRIKLNTILMLTSYENKIKTLINGPFKPKENHEPLLLKILKTLKSKKQTIKQLADKFHTTQNYIQLILTKNSILVDRKGLYTKENKHRKGRKPFLYTISEDGKKLLETIENK